MNMRQLNTTLILAAALSAAGCSTPVPVIPKAIGCEPSAELLARRCAAPGQLPENATFQTLVDTMLADRQALRECAMVEKALRDSIDKCNQVTGDFNKKIDELNESNARR